MRLHEADRWVLRAANTGISAIIDPRGRINGKTNIFEEAVLKGTFSMRDGQTPYVKYGDYFVLLSTLFLATACGVMGLKLQNQRKRT